MQIATLKEVAKKSGVNSISTLRFNMNNYPFITLIKNNNGKTTSTNVYFTQNSSKFIEEQGFLPGHKMGELLKSSNVVLTENENKEQRYKLQLTEEAKYESIDLLFGESQSSEFPFDEFAKEFKEKEVATEQTA